MELLRFWLRCFVRLLLFFLQCLATSETATGAGRGDAMQEIFYEVEDDDGNTILIPDRQPRP